MRKPKTPLMSFLQRHFRFSVIADSNGNDFAEELQEKQNTEHLNRRNFITQSLGTIAVSGMLLSFAKEINAKTLPKIAIVGAGIAGLNAVYQLRKRGFRQNVQLYEGSSESSWGRIQTKKFGNGITAEIGGEFIDSDHSDIIQLAKEFRLPLFDTVIDSSGLIKDAYFFGGKHYSERQIINEFRNIAKKIKKDQIAYENEDEKTIERLDNISIEQYLKENLEVRGWLYDLFEVAYTSEFGLEIGEQSALNFVDMIKTDVRKEFGMFGDGAVVERYKIKGGNSQLIDRLKKVMAAQIETDKKLENIRQNSSAKYTLSFANGEDVDADVVVLALPFSTLRKVEGIEKIFTPAKLKAIKELGYGTSGKLLLETKSRVWREKKFAGYLFNEKIQNGWDYSQGQNKNQGTGGYTVFLGGKEGRSLKQNDDDKYINELNKAFPGFKDSKINSLEINWSKNDLVGGGYACYKVGQWTSISGEEITPQGNILFCGEHCSSDYQGYMNGGAETGKKAALDIIKKFGVKKQ